MISLSPVGLVLMIRNILLPEEEVRSTSRKSQIPLHHRLFVSAYGHKHTAVTNPQSLLESLYSLNSCSYNYQIQNKVKQSKMRRQYFVCTLRTQRINHLGILLLLLQPYTAVYTIWLPDNATDTTVHSLISSHQGKETAFGGKPTMPKIPKWF